MPRNHPKSKSADGKVQVAWRLDPEIIAAVKGEAAALRINSAARVVENILRKALHTQIAWMKRPEI